MSTRHPVHDEPPDVEHAGVVVDVQECDLVIVLPQDEKEGVHELNQLGEIIPPQDADNLMGNKTDKLQLAMLLEKGFLLKFLPQHKQMLYTLAFSL